MTRPDRAELLASLPYDPDPLGVEEDEPPKWRVPRGRTIEAVLHDALRQVLANYGDAIRRLR